MSSPSATAPPVLGTATQLLEAYAGGELSPFEAMEATLARASGVGAELRAFLTLDAEGALDAARAAERELRREGLRPERPLLGVPVSVKDLTSTAGLRTTRGSLLLADHVPDWDAPAVARIRRAGGIVFGKTNTSEAGWKADAGNRLLGPTANPWDPARSSGGSSGGAAAAVAAGIGPLATGTDGAGSIRIPAALCGVVGFKPTHGLVPYVPPSADRLAHLGPLARTVADAALLLNVMAGLDVRDPASVPVAAPVAGELDDCPRLRIALSFDLGYAAPSAVAVRATQAAADALAALGHEVALVEGGIPDPFPILDTIWAGAEAASHGDDLDAVRDRLDPGYLALIERGRGLSALQLARAGEQRLALGDAIERLMDGCDLLLTPALPVAAFALGEPGPAGRPELSWASFSYPFNLTGQPAISVPAGRDADGLPLAVQLAGRRFADRLVLQAARAYERACDWSGGYPDLWTQLNPRAEVGQR